MAAYEIWPNLDPNEILDFGFDWTDRLEDSETIVNSTWTIEIGDVTKDPPGFPNSDDLIDITGMITRVWLTAGTEKVTCLVTNHVVCSSGRERDRSAKLRLRAK